MAEEKELTQGTTQSTEEGTTEEGNGKEEEVKEETYDQAYVDRRVTQAVKTATENVTKKFEDRIKEIEKVNMTEKEREHQEKLEKEKENEELRNYKMRTDFLQSNNVPIEDWDFICLFNLLYVLANGDVSLKILQGKIGETDDGGEYIIEIMGQPTGQPAEGFHFLGLIKLGLQFNLCCDVLHKIESGGSTFPQNFYAICFHP